MRTLHVPPGVSGQDLEFHQLRARDSLCPCGRGTRQYMRHGGQKVRACLGCDKPVQDCRCKSAGEHYGALRTWQRIGEA